MRHARYLSLIRDVYLKLAELHNSLVLGEEVEREYPLHQDEFWCNRAIQFMRERDESEREAKTLRADRDRLRGALEDLKRTSQQEVEQLRGEISRMLPVVKEAKRVRNTPGWNGYPLRGLIEAVDRWNTVSS